MHSNTTNWLTNSRRPCLAATTDAAAAHTDSTEQRGGAAALSGRRILLVGDEQLSREALRESLRALGAEVLEAPTPDRDGDAKLLRQWSAWFGADLGIVVRAGNSEAPLQRARDMVEAHPELPWFVLTAGELPLRRNGAWKLTTWAPLDLTERQLVCLLKAA